MLDIISMITLLVFFLIAGFMYIIILGGSINKSDREEEYEMKEQEEYIKKWNEEHKNKKSIFTRIKEWLKSLKGRD